MYSGVKDYFGNNCLVLVDDTLKEIRVVCKRKEYTKERKRLNNIGLAYVIIQKYGEVIDFTQKIADRIENEFTGYKHTSWNIW